jgi:cytochrome P450
MTRAYDDLPTPSGYPLVGHLPDFIRGPRAYLSSLSRDHGDLVRFRIGTQETVVVTGPELIEELLVQRRNEIVKDPVTAGLSDILGQGLLTAEGETWRKNRRLIAPSFQHRHLADLGDTMVRATEAHLDEVHAGELDLQPLLMELTLDIAVRTLFGTVMEDTHRVGPLVEELMHGFLEKTQSWKRLLPDWVPTRGKRQAERARVELHEIVMGIVEQRREEGTEGSDLLSRLMAARDDEGHGMSDEQLRDELLTLFLAGHETTALALSYSLLLLATHPGIQQQVQAELDEVLGGEAPTARDSRRLPLLDAVFQESMRLYPPAWMIARQASATFELGGTTIPEGTVLMVPQWVVHRDPRWFEAPEAFRPQRWMDQELPHKFAFFPFGGGPRTCVGNHFARMEAVLVMASFLQRFELRAVPGFELELLPSVTLRPGAGVRVELVPRRSGRLAA